MAVAKAGFSRRGFLKGAGALVVGFSLPGTVGTSLAQAAGEQLSPPNPGALGSWLTIDRAGNATVFTGKVDVGMGIKTAFMQIVAEELDLPPQRVAVVMGDTGETPDQGGTSASTSISLGARPLRNAAAEARYLLMQRAAVRLRAPADRLAVAGGVVSVKDNPAKKISYGSLVADRRLTDKLKVYGKEGTLNVKGDAKTKPPSQYTVVGRSLPRVDVAPKAMGQFTYVVDVRVPGMLHGRTVRPPGAGAALLGVDERSIKDIPGIVKVVTRDNFVGVIAQTQWAAIQGAAKLKINWSEPQAHFPKMRDLYTFMTSTSPKASRQTLHQGNVEAALAGAAHKLEATYHSPFQAHANMDPGCAIAYVRKNGAVTIWSGVQKPHILREGIADLLRVPIDQVRVIWVEDAGSYGRPGFSDVAADATLLSAAVNRPVRLQWMRQEMTAWGTKAPAVVARLRGGLGADGKIAALDFESWAFSGAEIDPHYNRAGNLLAGQLVGFPNTTSVDEFYAAYSQGAAGYALANARSTGHIVPPLYPVASPLRTSHMRDPEGPQTSFAVESFIDEMAAIAGSDPVEFRLHHLTDPRAIAVIQGAAQASGWRSRPSPANQPGNARVVSGRGIAWSARGATGYFPFTYVATVAEVEVDRETGVVKVKRLVCAHDCGLVINPKALRGTIEGNLIQSMSRALKEEVTFDSSTVTSVDWHSYPIVRSPDLPDQIEVVLIDRPEIEPAGAGEPSTRPTAGAIGNAIFDATGVRVRQTPFRPENVKAALEGKV